MEGSISEISGWSNPEPDEEKVVNQEKAQKYGSFTFTVHANSESMQKFADNFPNEDDFEIMLQENLQNWQLDNKDHLDDGFWLNKPA